MNRFVYTALITIGVVFSCPPALPAQSLASGQPPAMGSPRIGACSLVPKEEVNRYAELYVRAGQHLVTVQANVDGTIDSVKPGVVNLAKALVAQLRR